MSRRSPDRGSLRVIDAGQHMKIGAKALYDGKKDKMCAVVF